MQCSNNVKQLSLALHTFHDAHNRLPGFAWDPIWTTGFSHPSMLGGERMHGTDVYSAFVSLLPFVEQTAVQAALQSQLSLAVANATNGEGRNWTPEPDCRSFDGNRLLFDANGNKTVENPFATRINAFLCPSDGQNGRGENQNVKPTNYAVCLGDSVPAWDWPMRGTFRSFRHRGRTSLATMSDGTSNTVVFSEITIGRGGQDRNVKTGIVNGGSAFRDPHGSGWFITPLECQSFRGAGGMLTNEGFITIGENDFIGEKGWRWGDSRLIYTAFATFVPPNGVSCRTNDNQWAGNAASSHHSGGVNVGWGDGSVSFISDSVNTGNQGLILGRDRGYNGAPGEYGGASTYGVWGAVGSAGGGEALRP
jgi:prepilin-type processing-associated H-X9-DG protein